MAWNFGLLGGSGSRVISSYELLNTTILSSSSPSVTFSSLGTYSADYQNLQIRYEARDDRNGYTASVARVELNGDTGTSYYSRLTYLNPSSSNLYHASWVPTNVAWSMWYNSANATGNAFGAGIINFTDVFETSKNTTWFTLSGGYERGGLGSGMWNNTASVTSITLRPEGNNWIANSRFSLYGLKGA
jgi:hypothetical protein